MFVVKEHCLWHICQRGRFRCQMTRVRIQSSLATFIEQLIILDCLWKRRENKRRLGLAHLK